MQGEQTVQLQQEFQIQPHIPANSKEADSVGDSLDQGPVQGAI